MEQIILKKSIRAYFQGANTLDSSLLKECFAENAVVQDEEHEYLGIAAILEWVEETHKKYNHTTKVISAYEVAGQTAVTALVTGNFEGSPANLDYHFTVVNEKITSLQCG